MSKKVLFYIKKNVDVIFDIQDSNYLTFSFSNTTSKILLIENGGNFTNCSPYLLFFSSSNVTFCSKKWLLLKLIIFIWEIIILTHKINQIFISSIDEDIQRWNSPILRVWIIWRKDYSISFKLCNDMRRCQVEFQVLACLKIKFLVLFWRWLTLSSWCQNLDDIYSFPYMCDT